MLTPPAISRFTLQQAVWIYLELKRRSSPREPRPILFSRTPHWQLRLYLELVLAWQSF